MPAIVQGFTVVVAPIIPGNADGRHSLEIGDTVSLYDRAFPFRDAKLFSEGAESDCRNRQGFFSTQLYSQDNSQFLQYTF